MKLLTQHLNHNDLGQKSKERLSAYRELFRHELEPGEIDKIRKATNCNFVSGTSRFQEEVGTMLDVGLLPGELAG